MAEIARWGGHRFEVSPSVIKSITDLQIRGFCETEDSENGDKYTRRKSGNPKEVTFTVPLSAYTGVNVRKEALAFVDEATAGEKDYFYVGGKKLLPCKVMLTEAKVSNVQIAGNGAWTYADAALTMKQADTGPASSGGQGGGAEGNGSGGEKVSVRPHGPIAGSITAVAMGPDGNIAADVKSADDVIRRIKERAKKASAGVGGGGKKTTVTQIAMTN